MSELHFEILPAEQRQLWQTLQEHAEKLHRHSFYLAGGTALALQVGHRQSVDLDFFSQTKDTAQDLLTWLEKVPGFTLRDRDADTIHASIHGVKISFIGAYKYPTVAPLVQAEGLKIASLTDIGLMKLLAVIHRATQRDYIDIAVIIRDRVPLASLAEKAPQKYGAAFNIMASLRALVSFSDLEAEMPIILDQTIQNTWQEILRTAVKKIAL